MQKVCFMYECGGIWSIYGNIGRMQRFIIIIITSRRLIRLERAIVHLIIMGALLYHYSVAPIAATVDQC